MADTFSIILTGEVLPDYQIRDVVPALAKLLKTTEEQAIRCLAGKETVIKRNVAAEDVARYLNTLASAGVGARQEPTSAPAPQAVVQSNSAAPAESPSKVVPELVPIEPAVETVSCPQCGHQQPKRTLCLQCGCDMPRMRAAKEQMQVESVAAKSVYQAPRAVVDDQEFDEEYETPKIFALSLSGRLGRLRYIAYGWAVMVAVAIIGILAAIAIPTGVKLAFVPLIAVGVVAAWMGLRLGVLRLHDLNRSGKWIFLPIVLSGIAGAMQSPKMLVLSSVVMWGGTLLVTCWPGSKTANDYGPPCGPNSTLVKVAASVLLVLQVVSGLAMMGSGMRSYQNYSNLVKGGGAGKGSAASFADPVYAEIRIQHSVSGRDLEMVYMGKMASDLDCQVYAQSMRASLAASCKDCTVSPVQCKKELSARDAMLFDNTPIHVTYLSMAAGNSAEREGRIVFWGLTALEGNQVCEAMKSHVQKAQQGAVRCISSAGG